MALFVSRGKNYKRKLKNMTQKGFETTTFPSPHHCGGRGRHRRHGRGRQDRCDRQNGGHQRSTTHTPDENDSPQQQAVASPFFPFLFLFFFLRRSTGGMQNRGAHVRSRKCGREAAPHGGRASRGQSTGEREGEARGARARGRRVARARGAEATRASGASPVGRRRRCPQDSRRGSSGSRRAGPRSAGTWGGSATQVPTGRRWWPRQ